MPFDPRGSGSRLTAVALPFAKNQARRLGERLRAADPPSPADLDMLDALIAAYDDSLHVAAERIRLSLSIEAAPRLKTIATTIEKLRRSHRAHLAEIQDLAGPRIVLPSSDRAEQDRVSRAVADLFVDGRKSPHVDDRRAAPSEGYRAVHVIVYVQDLPVEVQIRTRLQHGWAEYFEKLGDRVGRGIRYGEGPDVERLLDRLGVMDADRVAASQAVGTSVNQRIELAQRLSVVIDRFEALPNPVRESTDGEEVAHDLQVLLAGLVNSIDLGDL